MEFSELESPKRKNDGMVCVLDKCVSPRGENFETAGEFCSECRGGFHPEQVTRSNIDRINAVRAIHKNSPIQV